MSERLFRRPAAEVVEEMGDLARRDRARMTTPVPRAPRPPGRFYIVRHPPLPQPPRINLCLPDEPDGARYVQAAAISTRARQEVKDYLRPLLEEADVD